jgi:hypothetical protein
MENFNLKDYFAEGHTSIEFTNDGSIIDSGLFECLLGLIPLTVRVDRREAEFKKVGDNIICELIK